MRNQFIVSVFLLLFSACYVSGNRDASLTIDNESDYVLVEINLSRVSNYRWGRNLLRGDVLFPGESITIDYIDCDYYDVRVIDETGLACVITDLDLCFDDALWVVDNLSLFRCAFR